MRRFNLLHIIIILIFILAVIFVGLQINQTFRKNQRQNTTDKTTKEKDLRIRTQIIASKLEMPWSLAFISKNSFLFTERKGRVKFFADDDKNITEIALDTDVNAEGEGGLLGIAAHPRFSENKYIYIYSTYGQDNTIFNKVERFRFNADSKKLIQRSIIIDQIPGSLFHNGGRIKFGPDKKLYITTGDAENPALAQNMELLAGKILRLNDDGTIPADNPFKDSPVYSLGHRNPQGIAWHPESGQLYATEHGAVANDEINLIVKGGNYGWPEKQGRSETKLEALVLSSGTETWAPSGADFYKTEGKAKNNMFFAALRGNHLHLIVFDNNGNVAKNDKLLTSKFGRLRDVVFNQGALYVLTSNRDGRGVSTDLDDMIIKLIIE